MDEFDPQPATIEQQVAARRPRGLQVEEVLVNPPDIRHVNLRRNFAAEDNTYRFYAASEEELAALEADIVTSVDFDPRRSSEIRQMANHVARELTELHPTALPNASRDILRSNRIGSRVFLVDGPTAERFAHLWGRGEEPTEAERANGAAAYTLPRGNIIMVRDIAYDIWNDSGWLGVAQQATGATQLDDPVVKQYLGNTVHAVLQNTVVEEVNHLVQDITLPEAVREVLVRYDTPRILEHISAQTGEDRYVSPDESRCRDICTAIEAELHDRDPRLPADVLGHLSYGTMDPAHFPGLSREYVTALHHELVGRLAQVAQAALPQLYSAATDIFDL